MPNGPLSFSALLIIWPTALFWSNINPYGAFRLDMGSRLDLPLSPVVPGPRRAACTMT